MGLAEFGQREARRDRNDKVAAPGGIGNVLQHFGVIVRHDGNDIDAVAGIGVLGHLYGVRQFSAVADIFDNIAGHRRSTGNGIVEHRCRRDGADVDGIARQRPTFVQAGLADASNGLGTKLLEILDRSPADCAQRSGDEDGVSGLHAEGIDGLSAGNRSKRQCRAGLEAYAVGQMGQGIDRNDGLFCMSPRTADRQIGDHPIPDLETLGARADAQHRAGGVDAEYGRQFKRDHSGQKALPHHGVDWVEAGCHDLDDNLAVTGHRIRCILEFELVCVSVGLKACGFHDRILPEAIDDTIGYIIVSKPESTSLMKQWAPDHPKAKLMARKRAAIIGAARAAFLRRGYEGTSMEDIAATAGVSIMTLYRHSESKDDLFAAVITNACDPDDEGERDEFERLMRQPLGDIVLSIGLLAQARLTDPDTVALMRTVMAEATRFPELAESAYRSYVTHIEDMLVQVFAQKEEMRGLASTRQRALAAQFVDRIFGAEMLRLLLGLTGPSAALQRQRAERARDDLLTELSAEAALSA